MNYKKLFSGKRILVLGGTGSIGSVIVKELLKYNPKQVRVYSRDESKHQELLFSINEKNHAKIRSLIGDVRDRDRLHFAMRDIDIVFNAAAMKHVPFCEYNPFEAVKTNVYGTQNVLDMALEHNVEKVVTISTDKAAEPSNTLGATKLLAEKLTSAANAYKGNRRTIFASVRFGNVLGSSNSLLPIIRQQVLAGKPVTITDDRMTRFIMPTESAVKLVFEAVAHMEGGEIFVLKMPSVSIQDLIKAYVELLQKHHDIKKKITYKFIGARAGEKIHEKLLTEHEAAFSVEKENLFVVMPGITAQILKKNGRFKGKAKRHEHAGYHSGTAPKLSHDDIKKIILNLKESAL